MGVATAVSVAPAVGVATAAGAQGEALTLELLRQKPAATVTLCLCLVNSACAILSVVPSTHCVSCTIQCEETGSHFLSLSGHLKIFGTRRNARGVSVRVSGRSVGRLRAP